MKTRNSFVFGSLLVFAMNSFIVPAYAATGTWNGTTTAVWDTSATNWTGVTGTPWDSTNGPTNDAVFNLASLNAKVTGTVFTNKITATLGGTLSGTTGVTDVITFSGSTPSVSVATNQVLQLGTDTANLGIAGSSGLTKTGAGTLAIGGSSKAITGGIQVDAGTLRFTTGGGLGSNAITLGATGSATATVLEWANNSTNTSSNTVVINNNSGTKTLQVNSGVTATFSSLTLNGAVTKSNAGTLQLTNAGTFTSGSITITGGTIQANSAAALPGYNQTGGFVFNNSGAILNLRVAGTGWTGAEINALLTNATKTSGSLGLDTTNGSFTQSTQNLTLGSNLGTLGLIKNGANTLLLDQANTFTGGVTINAGTLRVTNNTALGSGNKNIDMQGTSRVFELSGGVTLGNNYTLRMSSNSGDGGGISSVDGVNKIQGAIQVSTGNPALNISSSAGSTLTIEGNITLGTTSRPLLFGGASTTDNTVSGIISNTGGGGNLLPVTKQGAGTWVFSGNNSYSGNTSINGGTLKLGHSNALGFGGLQTSSTATTTVASGFTLDLNGTTNVNEPIILNGTGIGNNGALVNNSASPASISTAIAGISVAATGSGSGLSVAPTVTISGTGSGAAATALLGVTANSITSITNGGTGWVVGDTFTVNGGGSGALFTVTSVSGGAITAYTLTNTGAGYTTAPTTVTKVTSTNGAGVTITGNATNFTVGGIQMTNAGSGYTGTPTVTFSSGGGTATPTLSSVILAANSSVGGSGDISIAAVVSESGGSRSLTKVGAGKLTLSGTNTFTGGTSIDAGTLELGHATDTLSNSGAINVNGGTLALGTNVDTVGAVTLTSGSITGSGTAGQGVLTGTGSNFDMRSGSASAKLAGTVGLNKSNVGTVTLSGANTYTGDTTISEGTLSASNIVVIDGSSHLGNAATAVTLGAASTQGTLSYTGNSANYIRGFVIGGAGGGLLDVTTSGQTLQLSTGNVTGSGLFTVGGAGNTTINSNLAHTGGLTKVDAGNLTISGASNSYAGLTTVSAGVLTVTSGSSLNSGNALTLGASGAADFANAGQTLGAVNNANTATNALNFSASTGTITLASLAGSGNTRFGSNVTVTDGISVGTVNAVGLLTAAVSGGTVGAGSLTGAISGGAVTVTGLTTGAISGSGTLSSGSLTSTSVTGGTNTITGNAGITTLNGGATTVGGVATIGTVTSGTANLNGATSAITTLNGGTINLGSTTVLSVSNGSTAGTIAGSNGSLTKNSAGTLTLQSGGTFTYTGATNVSEGKLIVNGSIASTSVVVAADATLGGSGTMGAATLSGAGMVGPGNSPGILTTSTVDVTGGLDFSFEFTGSTPVFNNATGSGNDVLRLTGGTPFTGTMNSTNIINIYLNVGSLAVNDVFTGGFYTDTNADFMNVLSSATFNFFLKSETGVTYEGNTFTAYSGPLTFDIATVTQSADFGVGVVVGRSMQFTAVPESSVTLLGGLSAMLLLRRRRVK